MSYFNTKHDLTKLQAYTLLRKTIMNLLTNNKAQVVNNKLFNKQNIFEKW